ncbi:MAG: ribosomal methyltransferase RsmE [Pseudomonadota bacterium]|jgi:16S rRNA (uracil1498-N3)-methyltransferase
MITPRFYINHDDISGIEQNYICNDEFILQHIKALRLNIGALCSLFNGVDNMEYTAEINEINKKSVCFHIIDKMEINRELPKSINLIQSLINPAKLEFILEKTTELGIDNLYLVPTSYSNVSLKGEAKEKKLQRFTKITISACEQCGRNTLPKLQNLDNWQACMKVLQNLPENTLKIFLTTNIANNIDDDLRKSIVNINDLNIHNYDSIYYIIGAEGGLTDKEQSDLFNAGCIGVSLGNLILRAETASIAVLSYLNIKLN